VLRDFFAERREQYRQRRANPLDAPLPAAEAPDIPAGEATELASEPPSP
jgi:tRNA(adenine34) deaminase